VFVKNKLRTIKIEISMLEEKIYFMLTLIFNISNDNFRLCIAIKVHCDMKCYVDAYYNQLEFSIKRIIAVVDII
jgi:hypothetical protein